MGNGEILIYQSEDQSTQIEVRVADETIWLNQKQIAGLFGCSIDNVGWHLKNIYKEEELKEEATSEDSSEVQQEGNRWVRRKVVLYNLDAVISVGYRVNSKRGTQFRIWALIKQSKLHYTSLHFTTLHYTLSDTRHFPFLAEPTL